MKLHAGRLVVSLSAGPYASSTGLERRIMMVFLPTARLRCCILLVASALSALPGLFVGVLATSAHAAGLECPEIGQAGVPELTSDPARAKLLLGVAGPDLANEVSELINQVQLKEPGISNADLTNGLIAAYCPLVAQAPGLTSVERWSQMHRFVQVLQQQLAANDLPPGSMIIAEVPVPPAVYRRLRSQAVAVGQTPAQLMASVLATAAGK
jgi:hypothetical protein